MDVLTVAAAFAEWTPVVSLVREALAPDGQGAGKTMYDVIAFLKGMEVLGGWGAVLAARTDTAWDDRAVARFRRAVGWALRAAGRLTTPGAAK